MKITFKTFSLAVLVYAIITIPIIVIPFMYFYSLALAVGFGVAAWLIYASVFSLVKKLNIITETKWLLLIVAVPIGVAFGYTLIEVFGVWNNVWNAGWLMLFPLAATVAGWISLYKTRNEIDEVLNPSIQEYQIY
ncbi:MAG: hypothetical protein ACOVO1_13860 [Chitinophagaceae bacterium]